MEIVSGYGVTQSHTGFRRHIPTVVYTKPQGSDNVRYDVMMGPRVVQSAEWHLPLLWMSSQQPELRGSELLMRLV